MQGRACGEWALMRESRKESGQGQWVFRGISDKKKARHVTGFIAIVEFSLVA